MMSRLFLLLVVCRLTTGSNTALLAQIMQELHLMNDLADGSESRELVGVETRDPTSNDPVISVVPADPEVQVNTVVPADPSIPLDPVYSGPPHPGMIVKNGVINPESKVQALDNMDNVKPPMSDDTYPTDDDSAESDDDEQQGIMKVLKRIMDTLGIKAETENNLNKRIATNQLDRLWPKCIIPYKFVELEPSQIESIIQAFRIYEKYTCFRFYEWDETVSEDHDLGHNNYLEFISNGGCSSVVGMTNNNKGQKISCCGAGICVHELGHAFGFIHEQKNPLRDDYIRVNYENIKSDYQSAYAKKKPTSAVTFPWKYDLSSVMHYGIRDFASGTGPTMTMLDPLTTYLAKEGDDTYYYFLRELESLYNCKGLKCPEDTRVCQYEGYLTFQDNQCSCRCLHGLDPDTNCASLLKRDSRLYTTDWPAVPFAVLKAKDVACPSGSKEGSLTHYGLLSWTARRHDADGDVHNTNTTMKFCTFADSQRTGKTFTFSPGQYCINRVGGSCPSGFTAGHVQYDDKEPPKTSGSLPDGNFDENARLEFCCRNDGNHRIPIELPLTQMFILWRTSKVSCQEVKDAVFLGSQYFGFRYPRQSSIASVQDPVPLSYNGKTNNIWLYYCVYQPITKGNCGGIIELTEDDTEAVIYSPNYPDPYNDNSECTWIVRSPVNTNIVLDFTDFEIPSSVGATSCDEDELEIGLTLPGQPGLRLCGSDYKVSMVSQTNMLSLILHSLGPVTSARKFKARVKMSMKDDELCYKTSDKGSTYRGHVNFAQDMKICLPWRDVSHCPHNVFEYSDFFHGLDENYCRTPGPGISPFCYTAVEGCVRNNCDVCGVGSCHDIHDDCLEMFLADNSYCLDNQHITSDGTIGCAATCNMCGRQISDRASTMTCATPTLPVDGSVAETLKSTYTVGEYVHFACADNPSYSATHTCTTSGTWDGPMSACQGCPDGWIYRNGNCYKFFSESASAVDATQHCSTFNDGTLIIPEDIDFVYEIMYPDKVTVWLGLGDAETEGTFLWRDGTTLDTTKLGASWKNGQPDDKNGQDCVEVNTSKKLLDQNCETKNRAYICQTPVKAPTVCRDARDDCASIRNDVPNMCTEYKVFAEIVCRRTCGVCTAPNEPCATK